MGFAPVSASKQVIEKYKRYLSTIFEIADEKYSKQFKYELNGNESFAKGPYLDVTDSFIKGKCIQDMIIDKTLPEGFKKLKMPLTRPLYMHQEAAISKANSGKNIVVSTGTGSGKTESFLIPIFNHLIRQSEDKKLSPGVRALLIYPMNALANDQIERLRELLIDYPEITYGSYTGQTKDKFKDAIAEYKNLNNGQIPLINELISREQIKETPPHILITNYAMLEYLMIRPDDSVFFNSKYSDKWKFIVLDEAHVYNGSTGIEVSMLLRRLKAKLMNDNIQYILTSATLGDDNQNQEVAEFASKLCDSKFDQLDVIRAQRVKPEIKHDKYKLKKDFYDKVADLINNSIEESKIEKFVHSYLQIDKKCESLEELLYEIILHDETYWEMRKHLIVPKTVLSLANSMQWNEQEIANFVTVASKCEYNGDRLFDARYHMFLRATESVFITLKPNGKLFLNRKDFHYDKDGLDYKVFEIATCNSCHAIYLVGKVNDENKIVQQSSNYEPSQRTVFLLADKISDTDEEHTLEEENINAEEYTLCSRCGFLHNIRSIDMKYCEHGSEYCVKVIKVSISNETGKLTKCLACENTNNFGMLRMFFTGQEAVTSVIGTALFEELPSYKVIHETNSSIDDSGFGTDESVEITKRTKEAKQFLAFSDSRQAAAFYSSYLDQTYRNILYKRLITETLSDIKYSPKGKNVNEFVEDLLYNFEKYEIAMQSKDMTRKEAWKAILQEIVDNNGNTALTSMGLLGISVESENISGNKIYNLTPSDVCSICSVFALGMMADAAIYYDATLNRADTEYFTHNGVQYTYSLSDSNSKGYKRSFIPTKANMKNKRQDYLMRVLSKAGFEVETDQANILLTAIWERILLKNGIVISTDDKYRVDTDKIIITKNNQWYYCNKCKKVTIHNVYGICPSYKCEGSLETIDLSIMFENNHYYQLYQKLDIRELRVVEHTAQLNKETAYDYQKKFKRKEIDVLSCSTTFEMGVDVGSLETVFMRNMPPSPANYAQRAGRAGRSKHSAAYAITFCNKSNHDFAFFLTPERMIKGKIDPPKFIVENDKIAIRHLYASSLGFFWKENREYFSKASDMTEKKNNTIDGFEAFERFLRKQPKDLKDYTLRFLPSALSNKFGADSFGWISGLINSDSENPGVLTKAIAEYNYEVNVLEDAYRNSIENGGRTDHLRDRIRVYKNEDILSFLSRKNVLPKYGFPVDTVEMMVVDRSGKNKLGLQLQRDLSIAISEYAPGSQIVANGNLITSRYIKKIPNMSWKMFDYIKCIACDTLNIEPHGDMTTETKLHSCRMCKVEFNNVRRYIFLIPAFGFEADGDKIEKPGLIKPDRTYRTDVAYVGYRNNVEMQKFKIGFSEIELGMSQCDEMAVLNESDFFVCKSCGFTDIDEKQHTKTKRMKHRNSSGYFCKNDGENRLERFSLGYRFETDVVQLRFLTPDIYDKNNAISILHGLIKGICSYLNIEQNDISGCLQYFYNEMTYRNNFSLILYDKTPGGAGHVRRLNQATVLDGALKETLKLMNQCNCGGDLKDSSCYSCLRNYYNQKYHDNLKRNIVINFINEFYE